MTDQLKTGVYAITCMVNGKRYVGSAAKTSICTRWHRHRSYLRAGKHHSSHLQFAWNKYGEDAFAFSVLVNCCPDQCLESEQRLIDEFRSAESNFGYNMLPNAGSRMGMKHSPETIAKCVFAAKNRNPEAEARRIATLRSPEFRAKVSKASTGRRHTAQTIEKMKRSQHNSTPERRAQCRILALGKKLSEESKNKIRIARLGSKASSETRAKMRATHSTNASKMCHSVNAKKAWQDPLLRPRLLAGAAYARSVRAEKLKVHQHHD